MSKRAKKRVKKYHPQDSKLVNKDGRTHPESKIEKLKKISRFPSINKTKGPEVKTQDSQHLRRGNK